MCRGEEVEADVGREKVVGERMEEEGRQSFLEDSQSCSRSAIIWSQDSQSFPVILVFRTLAQLGLVRILWTVIAGSNPPYARRIEIGPWQGRSPHRGVEDDGI